MGRAENLTPFQPGHPGGPGRPKGSRSKLQEAVIRALYENFAINGADAIEKVRLRKPEVYLMACVSLLPKQAQKVESPFVDVSDAELEALEQHLAVVRAKMVNQIEGTAFPSEGTQDHGNGITPRSRVANTETDRNDDSASRQETLDLTTADTDIDAAAPAPDDQAA